MGDSKKEVNIQTDKLVAGLFIVFIISIFVSIILKLMGVSWFDLYGNDNFYNNTFFVNKLVQNIILGVSLTINTVLILGIALKLKLKEIFMNFWVYLIFILLINMKYGNGLDVMLVVFIPIILKYRLHYKPILRFLLVIIMQFVYGIIIFWLRSSLGVFEIMKYNFNFYETIIFNIDMYLIMGIIYILTLKEVQPCLMVAGYFGTMLKKHPKDL